MSSFDKIVNGQGSRTLDRSLSSKPPDIEAGPKDLQNAEDVVLPMKSISRCLDVLESLSGNDVNLTQISKATGLPFSSVHRILGTLISRGFVMRSDKQNYSLGYKLLELVDRAGGKGRYLSVMSEDILEDAADKSRETVAMTAFSNYKITVVKQIQPRHSMRVIMRTGEAYPLYASASGRAVLAALKDEDLEWYLQGAPFIRLTPNTLITASEIREEIRKVQKQGYSFENQEVEANIVSLASAVLDHGNVLGAVTISGPLNRIGPHNIKLLSNIVTAAAVNLSERIMASEIPR